jgi:hypothetical protein
MEEQSKCEISQNKNILCLSLEFLINSFFDMLRNIPGVDSVLVTLKSVGVERGQLTYFALILAAIDNNKPISEYLKGMEANNVGISEAQFVKILYRLAEANNTKLLSSVRFTH